MKFASNIAWNRLVNQSESVVKNDSDENDVLLQRDAIPRGCCLNCHAAPSGAGWKVKYYIGGASRTVAKGTLYQCAKFYDYSLIFFEKYRVKKEFSQFNFNKEDAESDMAQEPAIGEYLESLENYLLGFGDLQSAEQRAETRVLKVNAQKDSQRAATRKWRHKQSASYQILSAIAVLRADVLELRELLETKNLTDS